MLAVFRTGFLRKQFRSYILLLWCCTIFSFVYLMLIANFKQNTVHDQYKGIISTVSMNGKNSITYGSSCPSLPVLSAPLLWHSKAFNWYTVRKTEPFIDGSMVLGKISLDEKHIKGLRKTKRDAYEDLGRILELQNVKGLKKWMLTIGQERMVSREAIFHDVVISPDGWIIHSKNCSAVRNGGCYSPNKWSSPSFQPKKYERIISIANFWGTGYWHFVMESLVGLSCTSRENISSSYIHISAKTKWATSWLRIVGVPENKIIEGTVIAKTAIVPELGRCGAPSFEQLQWLRTFMKKPVNRESIVLIQRSFNRLVRNFQTIIEIVQHFAITHQLEFILHDDRNLPSVELQLKRFAKARIIIGPHGSGLVNIISALEMTCVVEFLKLDPNVCYMRLSYLLGHIYFAVPLYNSNFIDIEHFQQSLKSCLETHKVESTIIY